MKPTSNSRLHDKLRLAPSSRPVPPWLLPKRCWNARVTAPWRPSYILVSSRPPEALFQSIRMQLSVERYQAIEIGRGATLDTLDVPLNDRRWLKFRFEAIRKLDSEAARLRELDAIVHWTDPGPGGYYDDLGNASRQPHLNTGIGFAKDPRYWATPQMLPGIRRNDRRSWWDVAMALYDSTLKMHYPNLDPHAAYQLRVVYAY